MCQRIIRQVLCSMKTLGRQKQQEFDPVPLQKFLVNSRVRIRDDISEDHNCYLPSGCLATVRSVHSDMRVGDATPHYFLDVDGIGGVGWYLEHQLEIVE